MRTMRVVTIGTLMMAFFLLASNIVYARPSLWPSNKGEVCLANSAGERARLAVSRTIGDHYIVHGTSEGADGLTLVNGNAEVVDNRILMHVTGSGFDDPEVHGFIGWVDLDASTLIGTYRGIGHYCDPSSIPECGHSYESQGLAPCH